MVAHHIQLALTFHAVRIPCSMNLCIPNGFVQEIVFSCFIRGGGRSGHAQQCYFDHPLKYDKNVIDFSKYIFPSDRKFKRSCTFRVTPLLIQCCGNTITACPAWGWHCRIRILVALGMERKNDIAMQQSRQG